jgi:hypothetical protein
MQRTTLAVACAIALGCGEKKPPEAPAATEGGPSAPIAAASDASAPAAPATPATIEAPEAGAPGASAQAATDPGEAPDPCGPIATSFEKSVRPDLKACYREGKKKKPDLEGSVRIAINVDMNGRMGAVKASESELGKSVVDCMVKVVKAATASFDGSTCKGKIVTIPMQFPTK